MTSDNFVYWLQGFFEISGNQELTKEQVQIIKDHIALVLDKKTPFYNQYFQPVNHINKNDDIILHNHKTKFVWENGKWITVDATDSRLGYTIAYPDGPPASC
jgi:hypothetical protein